MRGLNWVTCQSGILCHLLFHATGSPKLLDALSRYADHIDRTFGVNPVKKRGDCGEPDIELALVQERIAFGHLYAQGTASLHVDGKEVRLRQITYYPWEGEVNFEISLEDSQNFALHLRVPSWCNAWQLMINGFPAQTIKGQQRIYFAWNRTSVAFKPSVLALSTISPA
jgi:DUF1680 family protein